MRHGNKTKHLSRSASHRKAMMANMASSLIEHKRINTTTAKAKALRGFIEPLVTKSKTDTTHNRRLVFAKLRNKQAVSELFRAVAPKVGDRPGGYTRVIKLGNRQGDNAEMAMIELVDFNEIYDLSAGGKKKTRRSRRSRGGGKKAPAASTEDQNAEKDTENDQKASVESKDTAAKEQKDSSEAVSSEKNAEKGDPQEQSDTKANEDEKE